MSTVPTLSILEPVKLRSGAEHVAERLVTAIALGEFVPGQRLPAERELAGMLEVSRSTVREALQRLVATGYVKIHRGRNGGAVVQADWAPGPPRWSSGRSRPTGSTSSSCSTCAG